jgi:hypothetical protein
MSDSLAPKISEYDVLNKIKTSWTYLSAKGYEIRPRPGIYGMNIDDSIARLAKKLSAPVGRVRQLVTKLLQAKKIEFVKNRLMATRRKPAVDRATIKLVTFEVPSIIPAQAPASQDPESTAAALGLPPGRGWLITAWAEHFGPARAV